MKSAAVEPAVAGSTRTIEDYVQEIVQQLDALDYKSLLTVYETLQKMKKSVKAKHEQNYWKVLQCLGEVSVDKFIRALVRNEEISCKCHTYSNLWSLMQLFTQMQINVSVIKRQLANKEQLIPVFFKALRQKEDPALVREALIGLYRLVVVGRAELVEIYMDKKFLADCYAQIKCRYASNLFGIYALQAVAYVSLTMYAMAIHGTPKCRRIIKNSPALRILTEYAARLYSLEFDEHEDLYRIVDHHAFLTQVVSDESKVDYQLRKWKPKIKLRAEFLMEEDDSPLVFCSSSTCRKQYSDHFRYCGACKLSRYCSEACQKDHWKKSHKVNCLKKPREELF